MRSIIHKKGRHRSRPFRLKRTTWLFEGFAFTPSCRYDVGEEQKDWNKLIGLKKGFFRPMRDSVMVAWRYNPKSDRIELTAYTHEDDQRTIYARVVSVRIGEPVVIDIDLSTMEVSINDWVYQTGIGSENKWWLINSWFGGTCPAPHRMEIKRWF